MSTVIALLPALYPLFTYRADALARATGFLQRRRAFSGSAFLQALVFGWLRRPQATLEDLATPLGISRQALAERFTTAAVDFARSVLLEALQTVVHAPRLLLGCLQSFQGVYIDDCTQLWLPDDAQDTFPGCGSAQPQGFLARMKVLLRWELQGGGLHHLGIHSGRTADGVALQQAPSLPAGSLHLADLGFTDFARLRAEDEAGIFWLTRLPVQTRLFPEPTSDLRRRRRADKGAAGLPLAEQLAQWRRDGQMQADLWTRIGDKEAVRGRLLALRCPADVVARRLAQREKEARRRGRPVSERQREMCHWWVYFTNVPQERWSVRQAAEVYRLRWQIELLIKRFKSEGGLGTSRSQQVARVECEWYLKLLGQVVRNWLQLLRGSPLSNVNSVQLGKVIEDHLREVWQSLEEGVEGLWRALLRLRQALEGVRPRTRRVRQKPVGQRWAEAEAAQTASGGGSERRAS